MILVSTTWLLVSWHAYLISLWSPLYHIQITYATVHLTWRSLTRLKRRAEQWKGRERRCLWKLNRNWRKQRKNKWFFLWKHLSVSIFVSLCVCLCVCASTSVLEWGRASKQVKTHWYMKVKVLYIDDDEKLCTIKIEILIVIQHEIIIIGNKW